MMGERQRSSGVVLGGREGLILMDRGKAHLRKIAHAMHQGDPVCIFPSLCDIFRRTSHFFCSFTPSANLKPSGRKLTWAYAISGPLLVFDNRRWELIFCRWLQNQQLVKVSSQELCFGNLFRLSAVSTWLGSRILVHFMLHCLLSRNRWPWLCSASGHSHSCTFDRPLSFSSPPSLFLTYLFLFDCTES